MEREFTYTKERLLFIMEDLLETDVRSRLEYQTEENAEEGFEKRAAVEFVLWFLGEAFPDGFSFRCAFPDLENEYPQAVAERIVSGSGWSARHVDDDEGEGGNVIHVDFGKE